MDTPLWQTVLGTLAALGGGGVVIFGFSGFLGKIWADRIAEQLKASNTQALERIKADFLRDVESYKVQLKKSEFLRRWHIGTQRYPQFKTPPLASMLWICPNGWESCLDGPCLEPACFPAFLPLV